MMLKIISPYDLVALEDSASLRVHLAYARDDAFCGAVYRPDARLWLHQDLAAIVIGAAKLAGKRHNLRLIAYDGLRTVTAQRLMMESPAVKEHPQWLEADKRVLSPPGFGGHPRGMAVDVNLETKDNRLLDMGTAFDELPVNGSGPDVNHAHRLYADLSDEVKANRAMLDSVMMDAAASLGMKLWPLPVEWWDFRFPPEIYEAYAPIDDADLPEEMRVAAY